MSRGVRRGDGLTPPPSRHTRGPVCRVRGDEGFVLLESIVSITLITVIMAALTSLFVTVIRVNSEQRARQVAVQVADSTASYVRSLPTSDLLPGRTASAVDAQWSGAPVVVTPYLAAMEKAVAGGAPVLPLTLAPQVVHGISYTVNVYLGWCHTASPMGSTACVKPAGASAIRDQLRAVIGVSWPDRHCGPLNASDPTPTCAYVSATLVSTFADPVFNLNQPAATLPVIKLPSFTGFAVGDTVDLQMDVEPGTGVPVLTWLTTGGSWPTGVGMDTTGHITGTITAPSPDPITVTVTDGFVRKVAATFTWTVAPALRATGPGTRDDVLGGPIPPLTLGASGGAGAPYAWSDPQATLPPGLSINGTTGVVTGTPTAVGSTVYPASYAVVLTVADKSLTRKATVAFVWTIRYPPLVVATPGPQTDSVGHLVTPVQLSATGGTGSYTWSSTALPPGLTLTTAGLIRGTTTTPGSTAVRVTVSDGRSTSSATFTWTVVAGPSITTPKPDPAQVGTSVTLPVASSCPHPTCSFSATGLPGWLSISPTTGTMTGTPTAAGTFTNIRVIITDTDGVSATTDAFSWVVTAPPAPTIVSPGDLRSPQGAPVKILLTSTCPAGPCVYTLKNGPPGVSIDGTGLMTGAVGGATKQYTGVTITIQDKNGVIVSSATFRWTVEKARSISATWPVFTSRGDTPDQPLFYNCQPPGGRGNCTVNVSGQPSGVGLSATPDDVRTTHDPITVGPGSGFLYLSGTVASNAPQGSVTVTLTITGQNQSDTSAGTWTVR